MFRSKTIRKCGSGVEDLNHVTTLNSMITLFLLTKYNKIQ